MNLVTTTESTDTSLPSREVIEQRLEKQRDRVFKAHGICVLAIKTAWEGESEGGLDNREFVALREALEVLEEFLDDVQRAIDPLSLLRDTGEVHSSEQVVSSAMASVDSTLTLSPDEREELTEKLRGVFGKGDS